MHSQRPFTLVVWCKACRLQEDLPFSKLVDQGLRRSDGGEPEVQMLAVSIATDGFRRIGLSPEAAGRIAPCDLGWCTHSKCAAYNRVYHRARKSIFSLFR
jgi:hypothetical protein